LTVYLAFTCTQSLVTLYFDEHSGVDYKQLCNYMSTNSHQCTSTNKLFIVMVLQQTILLTMTIIDYCIN